MAKMNELSLAEQEALYDEFVEAQKEELRKEGAEELRIEILRELEVQKSRAVTSPQAFGLQIAMVVVEKATR
jgi:hypothetical protein